MFINKRFMKVIFLVMCFLILIGTNGCSSPTKTDQQKSDENLQIISNYFLEKPTDEKITIANEGFYRSDKGIEINISHDWDKIVEIKEDSKNIVLTYIGIPDRRFEIFTISCFAHDFYSRLLLLPKQDANYYHDAKIAEDQKYVFCFSTPLTIDVTPEEEKEYSKQIQTFNLPNDKLIEKINVVKI